MLFLNSIPMSLTYSCTMCYVFTSSKKDLKALDAKKIFYKQSYLILGLLLAGSSCGLLLSYFYRNKKERIWILSSNLKRALVILVEMLLASGILTLAIRSKHCDGDDRTQIQDGNFLDISILTAIFVLGLINTTVLSTYTTLMPELSKVPRNWQTTAFFQRNTFKSLGYILGFSIQITLIIDNLP